ncbi:MAG: hypothetical protein Q4G35_02450 [Propionibacteriaceae bacterium]|nr:hypothetical protein [Propionibacteriaceae bacterium]
MKQIIAIVAARMVIPILVGVLVAVLGWLPAWRVAGIGVLLLLIAVAVTLYQHRPKAEQTLTYHLITSSAVAAAVVLPMIGHPHLPHLLGMALVSTLAGTVARKWIHRPAQAPTIGDNP